MRPKVVLAVIGLALGLLAAARFLSHQSSASPVHPVSHNVPPSVTAPESPPVVVATPPAGSPPTAAGSSTNLLANAVERVAQLMDLAMNDDAESLATILAELTNASPEIRKSALEATVQFGDRASAARLEELSARTEDASERAELIEAAEFLKLPSLLERLAKERPAGRTNQAQPPTNAPTRGSGFRARPRLLRLRRAGREALRWKIPAATVMVTA